MSDLRLVVFDVDGTLIDSQVVILTAMRRAFESLGLVPPDDADIRAGIGLSLEQIIPAIAPSLNTVDQAAAVEAYRDMFVKLRAETGGEATSNLYDGALAALKRLHGVDNYLLGVATGKAKRGLDHVYASFGIGQYFVTHQTADFHPSKPHPAMLEQAMRETGVGPLQAVMIGDTEFDMVMGKAAGFTTIGVSWGYHPLERLRPHADHVIDHFDDLDATLDRIWGGR